MHLQQTKAGSRQSGGPQYYFHDVPDTIKDYLRQKGKCDVVLQTPYGIAESPFLAVGKDHKIADGRVCTGKVGHDRIQQASGDASIGEAIREWYHLPSRIDFERIDVDVTIHRDGHFIMTPLCVFLRGKSRGIELERLHNPLSFHRKHQSAFWQSQIERVNNRNHADLQWVGEQLRHVLAGHNRNHTASIAPKEEDLLRASGALFKLGMQLGAYVGKGYDCPQSRFEMLDYPAYVCPVEVKKSSTGFKYQLLKYFPLPRAVILCIRHDMVNLPEHVDVVELATLAKYVSSVVERG